MELQTRAGGEAWPGTVPVVRQVLCHFQVAQKIPEATQYSLVMAAGREHQAGQPAR